MSYMMLCLKNNNNKEKEDKMKICTRFDLSMVFGETYEQVAYAWVLCVVHIDNTS